MSCSSSFPSELSFRIKFDVSIILVSCAADVSNAFDFRRFVLIFYEKLLARKELAVSATDILMSCDVFLCI